MFYLIKEYDGLGSIIAQDKDKVVILRLLSRLLKGRQGREIGFSYKPIRELVNRKYRTLIKCSSGEEYFVSECLTVDFREYM